MKVKVDEDLCIGCNLCVTMAEDIFEMDGDVAKIKVETVPGNLEEAVKEAVSSCAVDAIIIEE
ncbi:ferredoxin [Elusimicrobiota bacterium]